MNTREYVDNLFSGYEQTEALIDFKEELQSNLDAKIENLEKGGMTKEEAFNKATSELGDITTIADEVSFRKKKEVLSEMYLKTSNYMDKKKVALYVLCGTLFGFGIIVTLLTFFNTDDPAGSLGAFWVFCGNATAWFTYLYLTQETASHEPMAKKRALLYAFTLGIFIFGIFVFTITYFSSERGMADAIATLIPFVLPSMGVGIFLILTEKDRRKPWYKEMINEQTINYMERYTNPKQAEKYGLLSGATWIFGISLFVFLIISGHIIYSWIGLVGALIIQMLITAKFSDENNI